MKNKRFTKEEKEWVINHFEEYETYKELSEAFNITFGEKVGLQSIRDHCKYLGLHKKSLVYTKEEDDFLRENIDQCICKQLTERYNKEFNRNRTERAIRKRCEALNIKFGYKGSFKCGMPSRQKYKLGDEVEAHGYIFVKTSCDCRNWNKNYTPKQVVVYEEHYGKIPKGHKVIFLDGNNRNFDIDNLYCVNNQIIMLMGKHEWFKKNKDITLTAIKLCELYFALKQEQN